MSSKNEEHHKIALDLINGKLSCIDYFIIIGILNYNCADKDDIKRIVSNLSTIETKRKLVVDITSLIVINLLEIKKHQYSNSSNSDKMSSKDKELSHYQDNIIENATNYTVEYFDKIADSISIEDYNNYSNDYSYLTDNVKNMVITIIMELL